MENNSLVYRINDGQGPELLIQVFLEKGWVEYEPDKHGQFDWNIWWRTSRFRQCDYDQIMPWQRLNHYPKSTGITKKDSLARHLKRMKGVYGASVFNFSPIAFNLPNDYTKYVAEYTKLKQGVNNKNLLWICKPADLSRGRGIMIFRDLSELQYDCNAVVQRYITNPLLIGGYKFDIRIYVAVPCFYPLSVYIYQEGIVRFSTDKFDLANLRNVFAHLTNTSINKHSPNYSTDKERVGPGCKWTLSQLRYYFHQNNIDDGRLWKRITNIVTLTLMTQAPMVTKVDNCFELYGFDILVDENLKPWLLEVNFSPSLSSDCQVDVMVKKPMLHDLMDMMNFKTEDANHGGDVNNCGHTFSPRYKNKSSGRLTDRTSTVTRLSRAISLQKLPTLTNSSRIAPVKIDLEGGSSFLRMAEPEDAELKPIFGLPLSNQLDEGCLSDNETVSEINDNNNNSQKWTKGRSETNLKKSASSSLLVTLSESSRTRESSFYETKSTLSERNSARKHGYKLHKVLSKGSSISDSGISSFSGSSENSDVTAKQEQTSKSYVPLITEPVLNLSSAYKFGLCDRKKSMSIELLVEEKPVKKFNTQSVKKNPRTPFKSVSQITTVAKTRKNAFVVTVPRFQVGDHSESDDASQTSTVMSSPPRGGNSQRRRSHVAMTDSVQMKKAATRVRSLNSGPSSLPKRQFNGTRKAPLRTGPSQFTFSKPTVPKGPKEVIGEFYLAFPFNEVTRKTAVASLDARVIIRETQKLLAESSSKTVATTGSTAGSFFTKVPKLWGPVKNVESE